MARVIILGAGLAEVAVDIISDVAVKQRGLGYKREGRGSCWGSMSQLGSVCHCFRDAGGGFEAGGMVIVAIVNELDVGDGGHVGIANDNVAVVAGVSGISRGEMGG